MKLNGDIGSLPIKDVIKDHPEIGEILAHYEIGCTKYSVGKPAVTLFLQSKTPAF